MKGNKVFWFLVVLLILAIGLMLIPNKVGAEDGYPKGVQVFSVEDHTCVLFEKNGGDKAVLECFCPCESDCNVVTYTDDVDKPKPTDKPQPTPTDPPKPTDKPKCNSGRGNGSEGSPDCDPGNSGGKNKGGD